MTLIQIFYLTFKNFMTIVCRYLILTDVLPSFTSNTTYGGGFICPEIRGGLYFCLTIGHDALSDKRGCTLMSVSPISPRSFFGQTFSVP